MKGTSPPREAPRRATPPPPQRFPAAGGVGVINKDAAPRSSPGAAANGRSAGSQGNSNPTNWEDGSCLRLIAQRDESLGWQIVPTQWHRQPDGSYGQTPIPGVTGRVAFLTAEHACPDNLVLHRTGGPECIGNLAKPALRPPAHVTGFDVDHYGGKTGGDTIAALEDLLGPLPPTYSLTARGAYQPSRRLWFRHLGDLVIPDRVFTPHGGYVETVRTGHRFSWTEPAIHVRHGQIVGPVRWYGPDHCPAPMPHVEVLSELASSWVDYIRAHGSAGAHNAEPGEATPKTRDAVDGGIAKMIQRLHMTSPAGGKFRSDVFGLAAELTRREIARGTTTDNVMVQIGQIFADHPQRLTLNADDEQWISEGIEKGVVTPYRFVAAECFGLFGNYRAGRQSTNGQSPAASDADFWASRPELTHLYNFALSRIISPWALLGMALVRVIAATPPNVVLPALVGGVGSLNIFLALLGDSGDGKGGVMAVAEDAIDLGVWADFKTHSVGSGQGIAHAYGRYDKDAGGVVRHATSAILVLEEIDHLAGHARQNGSTTLPELRRLYMGERLSHLYVDVTKRVEIQPHTYRAGLIIGIQPERAGVLLNDTHGGTPQRFVWQPVTYPHHPDVTPDGPGYPWSWTPPQWAPDDPHGPASGRVTMSVPDCAVTAIRAARLTRGRGKGDPLDGHRLFCQEKVAAGFAILAGRPAVSGEDWQLAERYMAVSDATRGEAVRALAVLASAENTAKGKARAAQEVIVEDAKDTRVVQRALQAVLRNLERHGGWMAHSELRGRITRGPIRDNFEEAIAHLEAAGQIEIEKIDYQGQSGKRYRPTGSGP
jgi:hypothetical protein